MMWFTRRAGEGVVVGAKRSPVAGVVVEAIESGRVRLRVWTADGRDVVWLGPEEQRGVYSDGAWVCTVGVAMFKEGRVRLVFDGPRGAEFSRPGLADPPGPGPSLGGDWPYDSAS